MNYNYQQAVHDTHPTESVDSTRWPCHTLTETTMYVKREHFSLPIFAYEEMGYANLGTVREENKRDT